MTQLSTLRLQTPRSKSTNKNRANGFKSEQEDCTPRHKPILEAPIAEMNTISGKSDFLYILFSSI